jgi:hypothetical protein
MKNFADHKATLDRATVAMDAAMTAWDAARAESARLVTPAATTAMLDAMDRYHAAKSAQVKAYKAYVAYCQFIRSEVDAMQERGF